MKTDKTASKVENCHSLHIRLDKATDIYKFAAEAHTIEKHAKAILLDKENNVLYVVHIDNIIHKYNLVEVSYIIRMMIELQAYAIIFIVNCPEGKAEPDKYDNGFRRLLQDATFICGFQLKDYMLLNQQGYYSYEENKFT